MSDPYLANAVPSGGYPCWREVATAVFNLRNRGASVEQTIAEINKEFAPETIYRANYLYTSQPKTVYAITKAFKWPVERNPA